MVAESQSMNSQVSTVARNNSLLTERDREQDQYATSNPVT